MSAKAQHATITLEHSYSAPLELVFSEFADPVARAQWSAPSGDVLVYDSSDFRVGGRDVFRCGPKGDTSFRGETRYFEIVLNTRVVFGETLEKEGRLLAVALMTLEFESNESLTKLFLTVQMISFVGREMIRGYESGNKSALESLERHLESINR